MPNRSLSDKRSEKIAGVEIEILQRLIDARGYLVELFRPDEVSTAFFRRVTEPANYPMMAYLSVTKAGQLRGPHEHLFQTDLFVFYQGGFEVFLWDNRQKSSTYGSRAKLEVAENEITRVIVPPGVIHAYRAVGSDGTVINCPNKLYRGWGKQQPVDEIRHEDEADSSFQPW